MTYQEAWKVILGAPESTYEDNLKDAPFLLAEAGHLGLKHTEEYKDLMKLVSKTYQRDDKGRFVRG